MMTSKTSVCWSAVITGNATSFIGSGPSLSAGSLRYSGGWSHRTRYGRRLLFAIQHGTLDPLGRRARESGMAETALTRRRLLRTTALAAGALALPLVHGAHAAGKLSAFF